MASKGIIERLTRDHREVDDLIVDIVKANGSPTGAERFAELRSSLLAHAQAEDEVFYGRLEEEEEIADLIARAREEHQQIEDMIEELGELERDDEWQERFAELVAAIRRHVVEEEGVIFPRAAELLDRDEQARLGEEFAEIKADEIEGLAAEDDEMEALRR